MIATLEPTTATATAPRIEAWGLYRVELWTDHDRKPGRSLVLWRFGPDLATATRLAEDVADLEFPGSGVVSVRRATPEEAAALRAGTNPA